MTTKIQNALIGTALLLATGAALCAPAHEPNAWSSIWSRAGAKTARQQAQAATEVDVSALSVTAFQVIDYAQPQRGNVRSTMLLVEYDCKRRGSWLLATQDFNGPRASGQLVGELPASHAADRWVALGDMDAYTAGVWRSQCLDMLHRAMQAGSTPPEPRPAARPRLTL